MLATIFFLATYFENVSAFTGFTTAGLRFSIAFPKIGLDHPPTVGRICMFTEEPVAEAIVNYPRDSLSSVTKWSKSPYKLVKYQRAEHPIEKFYLMKTTGIYNTIYIEANAPIRVTVERWANNHGHSDTHVALPEVSCHTSYYVTTGPNQPFVVVLSFRFKVKIMLHFPKSTGHFDVDCSAKSHCAHNSKTSLTLGENKAWYLHISSRHVDLQNTRIQANKPIYVFAGNADYQHKNAHDTIISTISPTATWGKEYVVPRGISLNDSKQTRLLRFNTNRLPFELKQCDDTAVKIITLKNLITAIEYSKYDRPYVMTADTPFGLYQLLIYENNQYLCNVGFTNLIPTEQWINGGVYYKVNDSKTIVHILIYSTAAPKNVVVDGEGNSFSWEVMPVDKYFYGKVNIVTKIAVIYTKESNGRVMLYIVSQPKNKQSCSYWPMDFYVGKIYDEDCKEGVPATSDGVDNDCDGFIDEEWSNGQDDDNDGKVDEDIVEAVEESQWTAWTHACNIRCGHLKYTQNVRACKTNRFGKGCKGKTEICVPGLTCNITCSKNKIATICDCQKGCTNCTRSTGRCASCKDGYFQEPYCLRPCPPGWVGQGCWAGADVTKDKHDSKHSSDKDDKTGTPMPSNPMIYLLIAVASGLLFVCVIYVALRCDTNKDDDEEEEVVEEQDK